MNPQEAINPLPYTDAKKVGAADFYFALNATFRFIQNKFGQEGLRRYWRELGLNYYRPVSLNWERGGLPAVAAYWRAFFGAEPDAEVEMELTPQKVTLNIRVCPAIKHLRAHDREIIPEFCQHCYFVSDAVAAPAKLAVRLEGGNGNCRQTFCKRDSAAPAQDLARIKEAR